MDGILRSPFLHDNLRYLHVGSPNYVPISHTKAKIKYCSAMEDLKCLREYTFRHLFHQANKLTCTQDGNLTGKIGRS